ncbi:DUF1540 domain-containing protein [Papillibacter cinnamivorans]|uniref:DUF1540 domain-containing protein n=1 Tax=Papillibacter cinnamivorans DSM 12816 TaxID=1122930 RepID=A0A1W1YU70_9FIRM|nr:DUF1540 domain-containing protein [Papillibacter cinnamivorans]SMC39737.1 protein of unknown function [Papillibacter cinnamivorans DSM 12816]
MEVLRPKRPFWEVPSSSASYYPMQAYNAIGMEVGAAFPYAGTDQSSRQEPSGRIACNVESCVYHAEGDHCSAPEIQVGPENAVDNEATLCATYRHK